MPRALGICEGGWNKSGVLTENFSSISPISILIKNNAGVFYLFKDFLRNIKGTVLTPNLYKWFAVMDEVNEEEKVPSFQR